MIDPHAFDDMSDVDFCKMIADYYDEYLANEKDEDYVINPPQWENLLTITEYFQKLAAKCGGVFEPDPIVPKAMRGGVTVTLTMLDLGDVKEISEFCLAILKADAVCIDALIDGRICISVSVPYVFVKKKQ